MSEEKAVPVTPITTNRKALTINLDATKYGTLAEIGAGQEVARYFFQAGGAAGTVAKTMSAYDMTFSDAIYGKSDRYVSRDRLLRMLDHEFSLLQERLTDQRGSNTAFFAFADTVAAASYHGTGESHGWMGLRFQREPGGPPHDIVMHVRMWDKLNISQQQALGIVGVNLIYGAFHLAGDPIAFVDSLLDNLTAERIEVDMLEFHGPDFVHFDNRILSLYLVEKGLTNAVLFGPQSRVLQPSEVLRKKNILVQRGSFRPITRVNIDMLDGAGAQFLQQSEVDPSRVEVLLEITMRNLTDQGAVDTDDFLARVDTMTALGYKVLVSNYFEFFRLSAYFRRFTEYWVGIVLGVNNLAEIFNESYYGNLEGGILESFGRLFKERVKLYIYPMMGSSYHRYLMAGKTETEPTGTSSPTANDFMISARNFQAPPNLKHLYAYLLENKFIEAVDSFDRRVMSINSREVLSRIKAGEEGWEDLVPERVVDLIRKDRLFRG
jgi:hypothetical protein